MEFFLRSIIKSKQAVFTVLLISLVAGIGVSLPSKASADSPWCWLFAGGPGFGAGRTACNAVVDNGNAAVVAAEMLQTISQQIEDFNNEWQATNGWSGVISLLLTKTATILSYLCYQLAHGVSLLFNLVISKLIGDPDISITRNTAFLNAWNVVKGYANMLIVLGLIAAAAMMILRVWADRGKALLPQILITAVLLNFSIIFCGLMIDASNILMRSLTVGGDQEVSLVRKVNAAWNNIAWPREEFASENLNEAMFYFGINLYFNALYIIIALALLYFIFIIIQRYVVLALLFIISPLAFVVRVVPVPGTGDVFAKWWHNFLKYSFLGISAAFFLKVSVEILNTFSWPNGADITMASLNQLTLNFIIVIAILIIGLRMATKSAGPIAQAILSAAAAIGAAIVTGGTSVAMSGAGVALKASGAAGTAERGKNAVADALKYNTATNWARDLWKGAGTSAMEQKKAQEERMAADQSAERLKAVAPKQREVIATGTAVTQSQVRDKVAAIKAMAENGELRNLTPDQRKALMEYATNNGVSHDVFAKADPDLAKFNKKKAEEMVRTGKAKNIKDAEEAMVREAYAKYDNPDIKKMSDADKVARVKQAVDKTGKVDADGALIIEEMAEKGTIGKLEKALGGLDKLADQINHTTEAYGTDAMRVAKKSDPRLAEFDEKAIKGEQEKILAGMGVTLQTASATQLTSSLATAKQNVKVEAYKKLTAGTIRKDLSEDAITMDLIENISAEKISASNNNEGLSTIKIEKFKALLDDIENEINMAQVAANTARAAGNIAEANRLDARVAELDEKFLAIDSLR